MNRGQRSRQGPKRKPLLVNLSSDDEEVQFVQQIGPSGTRHTSRGASRGRGQGRGSNIGQIRPNFGKNQNKSLPSTSHHSSSTRGRGFLRGQPSWPRGKPITNRKQPVVVTMKVANNSNNNSNNNNKQGLKRKDYAPHSVALKKVTAKVHNPSLEKGRSSRTEQMERRPRRPRRPSPEVVEYVDLEEKEIIKQVIKASIKRGRDNFKVQDVTFFQALQSKAKCSKGCAEGHPKFGLIASENRPVIFTAHKNDEIVYSPTEPSLGELHGPLKIPEEGDILLHGIKWGTVLPERGTGVKNSCMIDSFLTDIKIRSLDKNVCFECLFFHNEGPGLEFERMLLTMKGHIVLFSKPEKEGRHQIVQEMSYYQDLIIKRIFISSDNVPAYSTSDEESGIPYQNLMLFAFNGKNHTRISENWRTAVQLSQDIQIMRRIDVVSIFSVICHCKCANEAQRVENIYCCAIRVLKSGQLTVHPGYRGANETSIRKSFANRYFGASKDQARRLWSKDKNRKLEPALPVDMVRCLSCHQYPTVDSLTIPETTWLIVVEIPRELQKASLRFMDSLKTIQMGGVTFYLTWVSILMTHGHFCSMHLYGKDWYFFDDDSDGGLTRTDPEDIDYVNKENLKAFYLRRTEKNPHRCLLRRDRLQLVKEESAERPS